MSYTGPLSIPEFYQSGADDSEYYGVEPEEDNDMSTDSSEVFCLKGQIDRKNKLIKEIEVLAKNADYDSAENNITAIRAAIEWYKNNEKGGS
jgi:hypothetical protein